MTLIAQREEMSEGYSRFKPIRELDGVAIRQAKVIFDDYKQRGIMVSGEFSDMSWTLSDEARKVGLTLLSFEGGTKKIGMSWIGCTYPRYIMYVKAYLLFNLGELSLAALQELTRCFNRLALQTSDEAAVLRDYSVHIVALLQLIPRSNTQRDAVILELEEKMEQRVWHKRKGNQRHLSDFKSYLCFHEILTVFWQNADEHQKLFYFPLYFWWNLTAILPLRPTEFLLTPRNCLNVRNGEQILTVRRTKLKGGNKKIKYHIADDYELKEYTINAHLAEELRHYLKATENMCMTEINTLFLQAPHFNYIGRKIHVSNRYYTYANLNVCRKYFFRDVVSTQNEDISDILLGDTRHLAMINLILSGGSPIICRELAGHASIDISAHYYSNIATLVECLTLERYRKSKNDDAMIHGSSKYPITFPQEACLVSGGKCASDSFKSGLIDDCLKVSSSNGHIGDCRYCRYYLSDNPGIMLEYWGAKAAKEKVDADSRYLIKMIEIVRKGLGYSEDIGTALLRLQHSGHHYGQCLCEQLQREEKE